MKANMSISNDHGFNRIRYPEPFLAFSFIFFCCLAFFCLAETVSAAPTNAISNSADWRDVYSTLLYSNMNGIEGRFLVGAPHATVILYSIPKDRGMLLVSSKKTPLVSGYKSIVEGQGYKNVEEISTDTANLDLAKLMPNMKSFIVIDDAYGYNAIAVAPYAVISKSYVLFANAKNARQIESFLSERNPSKVLLYGQVDAPVKTRLAQFDPEIINTGDRFDNNIEIVKRYLALKPTKQVILSNGEFIESGVMSGADPVLFIGRQNVPEQIKDFIKRSDIEVAILIGNELISSATTIRRQAEVSVFVKFAQGARVPSGSIAAVEDLDRFPMPKYGLKLSIASIQYNRATKSLEVTFKNDVALGAYLKSTVTLFVNGEQFTVGDENVVFIDKNQYKTFIYTQTTDKRPLVFNEDSFNASVYTLFGESRKSMENALTGTFLVQSVEILDGSLLNITDVAYDPRTGAFLVTVENLGTVDAYATAELQDLFINGEYLFVASEGSQLVKPGKKVVLKISQVMTDDDIANNQIVKVKMYYGERPRALIKTAYGEFPFKKAAIDYLLYGGILLAIMLIVLLVIWRKKCPECGAKNPPLNKRCKKCHSLLRKRKHIEKKE